VPAAAAAGVWAATSPRGMTPAAAASGSRPRKRRDLDMLSVSCHGESESDVHDRAPAVRLRAEPRHSRSASTAIHALSTIIVLRESPGSIKFASSHPTTPEYGGSVCVSWDAPGCLVCFDELDLSEARDGIAGPAREAERRAIYGVARDALGRTGPSVVSINGVVASLAVTEFMVGITGIRPPKGLLKYRGSVGKVTVPAPDSELPRANCYCCVGLRGKGEEANVERYIREGVGAYL
jgi:hypothetical protein